MIGKVNFMICTCVSYNYLTFTILFPHFFHPASRGVFLSNWSLLRIFCIHRCLAFFVDSNSAKIWPPTQDMARYSRNKSTYGKKTHLIWIGIPWIGIPWGTTKYEIQKMFPPSFHLAIRNLHHSSPIFGRWNNSSFLNLQACLKSETTFLLPKNTPKPGLWRRHQSCSRTRRFSYIRFDLDASLHLNDTRISIFYTQLTFYVFVFQNLEFAPYFWRGFCLGPKITVTITFQWIHGFKSLFQQSHIEPRRVVTFPFGLLIHDGFTPEDPKKMARISQICFKKCLEKSKKQIFPNGGFMEAFFKIQTGSCATWLTGGLLIRCYQYSNMKRVIITSRGLW